MSVPLQQRVGPCPPALWRLLSDVYQSEIYLDEEYLTPASHVPRLSESPCLISGSGGVERAQSEDSRGGCRRIKQGEDWVREYRGD